MAQPSDLPSPVPNHAPMTLGEIFSPPGTSGQSFGQYLDAANSGPARSPGVQGPAPFPTPQPNAAPRMPGQPAQATSMDELANAFGTPAQGQPNVTMDELANAFGPDPSARLQGSVMEDQFSDQRGPAPTIGAAVKDQWARFKASFGRSPTEGAQILEQTYGVGNVKVKDSKLYFRRPGEKKFSILDPKGVTSAAELLGDILDAGGPLTEGLVAAPIQAAGDAAGAAVALGGGPAAPVAAPALVGAGMAAGGAAGAGVRGAVAGALGANDPDVSTGQEAALGAAGNVLVGGAMKLAGAGLGKIWNAVRDTPKARIQRVAEVQAGIEDMAREYRVSAGGSADARISPSQIGSDVRTVVKSERGKLDMAVATARDAIESQSGDARHPVINTLNAMRQVFREQKVMIDPKTGFAKLSGNMSDEVVPVTRNVTTTSPIVDSAGSHFEHSKTVDDLVTIPGQPVRPPTAPLGSTSGKSSLEQMVNDYNHLVTEQKSGGVDARSLFRMAQQYGDLADYQSHMGEGVTRNSADKVSRVWRKVDSAARADRDTAAMNVLDPESADYGLYRDAMDTYNTRIEPLKRFEKIVRQGEAKGAMPTIADAIIKPNQPQKIQEFKRLFGDSENWDSDVGPIWDKVKSGMLDSVIDKARDPNTGLMTGAKMMSTIRGYGPDVLKEVFSPTEMKQLQTLALRLDKIPTGDLVAANEVASSAAQLPLITRSHPIAAARMLWKILSKDAKLSDELLDDGFMKAYRAAGAEERGNIVATQREYQKLYDAAHRIKEKSGREVLRIPNIARTLGRGVPLPAGQAAMRDQSRQGNDVPERFIPNDQSDTESP